MPFDVSTLPTSITEAEQPAPPSSRSRIWQFHDEYVLGTSLDVVVNAPSAVIAATAADTIAKEIERLNNVFNHRDSGSELSVLNRTRKARVSPAMFAVVHASEQWRKISRGAFDARIGTLLQLWSSLAAPSTDVIANALATLQSADVRLDARSLHVELPFGVTLSLDAIAKGYIVDAAINAARRGVPLIEGLAVSIGGDLRCWGVGPNAGGWRVGIPDATHVATNAPLGDTLVLRNAAIATSGRGPRDRVGNTLRSTTISPLTGEAVRGIISASVVASHAMDADAIATACMVLPVDASLALIEQLQGVAARITDAQGQVHHSSQWPTLQLAATTPDEHISPKARKSATNASWPTDWVLSIDYTAPPRQSKRSADFRSPYMAMWVTDENNKPVRTVLMVGRELDWQRDNFVWFGMNRARSKELVKLRSLPTSVSGRYSMYWAGMDDDGKPVPLGKYTVHLETRQERGKHNYRSVTVELGRDGFREDLPKLEGSGGVELFYGHPSERFKY